jgi:hypothetical protein
MERTGRARGGNPAHWFAVLSKIPLTELAFEIWIAQAWQPSQPSLEMAAVWENYAAARV